MPNSDDLVLLAIVAIISLVIVTLVAITAPPMSQLQPGVIMATIIAILAVLAMPIIHKPRGGRLKKVKPPYSIYRSSDKENSRRNVVKIPGDWRESSFANSFTSDHVDLTSSIMSAEAGHQPLIHEPLCRIVEEVHSSLEQYVEYVERIAAQIAENEVEDLRRRLEPFTSKLEGVIAALRDSVEEEDRRIAKELDDILKEARNVQSLLKSGMPSTAELVRLLANMKARIVIVRSRCR